MWHDNFSISARFSQVEILLQRQVSKIRAFMEMSNGNVAQTPNQEWQLCVIICSFVHSSFFMQSKNIISCEIMIPPSKAIGQPFISRSQPEKCFFIVLFLLFYTPRDSYGIQLLVSGAMYIVFVMFSIGSGRRKGCLSPLKAMV